MRAIGLQPDVIVCRTARPLTDDARDKISLFCNIEKNHVLEARDVDCLYEIPLAMEEQGLADLVLQRFRLGSPKPDLVEWKGIVSNFKQKKARKVRIALVGKYIKIADAYLSVIESITHASLAHDLGLELVWVSSEQVEKEGAEKVLADIHGVIVPGGFGDRGIEGKIQAIRYCRENQVPLLGICLGMQCVVIEFARHVAGMDDAHSAEFMPDGKHSVVSLMPDQDGLMKGGTMRLGTYPCRIDEKTLAHRLYGTTLIYERHRHRFEVNNDFRARLARKGLMMSGTSPDLRLVEMVEIENHPYFIACQFHPEFKSRPGRPHPLFDGLFKAAAARCS